MATLDYIDIPPGAVHLRPNGSASSSTKTHTDVRPATKIITPLPNPSPPPSPTTSRARQMSISSTASALASPTLSLIPQMLLSSSLPAPVAAALNGSPAPTPTIGPEKYTLLSTRDPLSLPIMTNNFKRFVARIGPVFWLQDRVEEIVLWKKGWKVTCTWMSMYAFLCFFPRFLFLVPHTALIAIILSTYPYPKSSTSSEPRDDLPVDPAPPPPTEGSIPWQANIQGIQNLMGAVSDLHALIEPHIHHLVLSPAHFRDTSSIPSSKSTTPAVSPYTPHILTLLTCTFPILLFAISLPVFPARGVCLVGGLAPLILSHPAVRKVLPYAVPALEQLVPVIRAKIELVRSRARTIISTRSFKPVKEPLEAKESLQTPIPGSAMQRLSMVLQRLMDDDRLTDKCWNSEMREVDLWENERLGDSPPHGQSSSSSTSGSSTTTATARWSKANLRPGERSAWTRGRDGWSGVGFGGGNSGVEGSGAVSSNLTFNLAPGWAFVETEDWRKDKVGSWSGVGADEDGWVYSNDAWVGPRPAPYTASGGSVTRRRRWTRRVWYDPERAGRDS